MTLKNIPSKLILASCLALSLFSCKPQVDVPASNKGSLDLSKYVAVGNSLTAGYADNALYYDAQLVSYPNLIAQQFKLAGGGNFKQPLVGASSVGIGSTLTSRLMLAPVRDCKGAVSLSPIGSNGDASILTTSVAGTGPFNNMGVPGAKSITIIYPGYGNPNKGPNNFNPFFTRMTTDPTNASILSDAAAQSPTFFSLATGMDDVYTYALGGGSADFITPSAGPAGAGFDASVDVIVNTLTAKGAKGVIANVPDIASLPFFTTVPYNGLMLDASNAAALNAAYAPLGITFRAGNNGFIIEDGGSPGGVRQIRQGEFILLSVPQDSLKCGGWGSMKPIPASYVLASDEVAQINTAITAYNNKLKSIADAKGLAYVDVNAFLNSLKSGIVYNGINISTQFVSGGAVSLDGIHLTPRGNALLANEFIKAINKKYGSTILQIDAVAYKGVTFP